MTLVIMAAGLGSRYGGLKQIDPISKNGEFIIDYSVYDAIKAGFNKVIFIIKEENYSLFKETIGNRIAKKIDVSYAFQRIEDVPESFNTIHNRSKPWGTAQAVLACKNLVDGNFAVINADDFYGKEAFEVLVDFLKNNKTESKKPEFCMVGYVLKNTLTDNGYVARGVCETGQNNYLKNVTERTKIKRIDGQVQFYEEETGYTNLDENSVVSMNCWGFTKDIFKALEDGFVNFLEKNKHNLIKSEYLLPFVVNDLLHDNKCDVKVLNTNAKWYGVTYHEDKEKIVNYVSNLIKDGTYPPSLWE